MSGTTTPRAPQRSAGISPKSTSRETPIDVRVRLAALWTTIMIIVVFVDLFSLYRADIRANIEAGKMFIFEIGETFLLGVIIYVGLPTLMIALSVLLPRRVLRPLTFVLAPLFAVTIIGGAVGEMGYYVLGSGLEIVLLAVIIVLVARWRAPQAA